MKEEIFELVDEQGNVIGKAPRSECHNNPKLIHRVSHVLVRTSQNEVILQYRPAHKDIQPDKWDMGVGGHFDIGETPLEAAKREMQEELGVEPGELHLMHQYLWRTDRETELVFTFKTVHDGPFKPAAGEVDEIKAWTVDEINCQIGKGVFTPNFEHEWEKLQGSELLASS